MILVGKQHRSAKQSDIANMNKVLLVFCLAVVAVRGQIQDLATYSISAERSEDYIKLNREQYSRDVIEFDKRLATFKQYYTGRIESLSMQIPLTVATVVQMEERLNPLELMGDFSNKCIVKYRHLVPTVVSTKSALESCSTQASNELPNLLKDPQNYRNSMFNYFNSYFEAEIKKCATSHSKTSTNYTTCITTVTKNTNANVISYQKTFDNMMDLAECTAKANLKRAVDCFTTVQTRTSSQIAEANVSINNCLLGKEQDCKPCPAICSETLDLQVDYKNETIKNPFFGAQSHKGCLLLQLK